VILTTTNSLANAINQDRLAKLPGKEMVYEATATGKFEESAYPTDTSLRLKKGAQVILIKNDPEKQWVNGTLAKVIALSGDSVVVDINGRACDVPIVKWQKIEYNYNEDEDKIEDEIVGAFFAISHKAGLGHNDTQEPGPDFRQGNNRPGQRSLYSRPALCRVKPVHLPRRHKA